MQVQGNDISSSESGLWQRGEKELIDDPIACGANRGYCLRRRMGGNDEACPRTEFP
jgi:hypothetical protein